MKEKCVDTVDTGTIYGKIFLNWADLTLPVSGAVVASFTCWLAFPGTLTGHFEFLVS